MGLAMVPFTYLSTPFTHGDSDAKVTTLGRVLQQLNSAREMRRSLEMGTAARDAAVPKSAQARAQAIATEFLLRACNDRKKEWRSELEEMRKGFMPESVKKTHSESKDDDDDDADLPMWVNRLTFSIANAEIARLKRTLGEGDSLKLSLEREEQTELHPLSSLMTAYSAVSLTRARVSGVLTRLMNVRVKRSGEGSATSLLGILSELERYYVVCDSVLASLDLDPLSPGDRVSIALNVFDTTRLMTLFRDFERSKSVLSNADGEVVDLERLLEHLRLALKTEIEDKSSAYRELPMIAAAVAPRGPPRRRDMDSKMDRFAAWIKKNPGKCMSCESMGHIRRQCTAPLRIGLLSEDNPLRFTNDRATKTPKSAKGAYALGPLTALTTTPTTRTDYILDTGAAVFSYLPTIEGIDRRTLVKLEAPIRISGVGGTTVVTHVGIAYANVRAFDGTRFGYRTIRFDAAVVPSLHTSGLGLIATQSFTHDGGFHSLINKAGDLVVRLGAVGALRDPRYRVEMTAKFNGRRSQNQLDLTWCSQSDIEKLAPCHEKNLSLRRRLSEMLE